MAVYRKGVRDVALFTGYSTVTSKCIPRSHKRKMEMAELHACPISAVALHAEVTPSIDTLYSHCTIASLLLLTGILAREEGLY
jgi:hypothetical protein